MLAAFQNLSLKAKIPAFVIGSMAAVGIGVGSLATLLAGQSLDNEVSHKLQAIAEEKAQAVTSYLASLEQDIKTLATSEMTSNALMAFENGWHELGSNVEYRLQQAYISNNRYPTGEKEKLDAASAANSYNTTHAQYHPWFREFLYERGYYDIFLFDREGNLIYSVFKELDYATNLENGKYKGTDLGNAYRAARDIPVGETAFFDFEPYAPSHGAPAAFLSTPVTQANGNHVGVLVFQMPIDRLNAVAGNAVGMGESGRTFLVGADNLLRTDIPSTETSEILAQSYDNAAASAALGGESGTIAVDHDGLQFHAGFAPLNFGGANYAAIAEQLSDEALSGVSAMSWNLAFATTGLIAVFGVIGLALARSITNPINQVAEDTQALAAGDLVRSIRATERVDEVGQIAKALDVFKENALASKHQEEAQKQKDIEAQEVRRRETLAMADQFERQIGEVANAVVSANVELERSAQELTASSEKTMTQISAVASASDQSSVGADAIAAAINELSAASREIAQQIEATSSATRDAVDKTQTADEQVKTLVECADKIGEIVAIISEIAEQTNLLALNATIEAARAGAAGSGFAVVASEVKNLASQTASATDDIAQQVKAIQSATGDTVSSIQKIRATIESVDTSSSTVAAAVQEQSVTVDEITRNVQEAASSSGDVSARCAEMSSVAELNDETVQKVGSSVQEIKRQGDDLKTKVDVFLSQIRSEK